MSKKEGKKKKEKRNIGGRLNHGVFQWKGMINYQDTPSSGNIVIMIAQETRTDKQLNQQMPSVKSLFLSKFEIMHCVCASTEHDSKPICIWFWLKMLVALHISVHNIIDLIWTQYHKLDGPWWSNEMMKYIVYFIQNDHWSVKRQIGVSHLHTQAWRYFLCDRCVSLWWQFHSRDSRNWIQAKSEFRPLTIVNEH